MKTKLLILIFSFLILTACGTSKPIATVHHERIEERLKPVVLGADTIEITLHSRDAACCVRSTSGSKNNTTSVEIQRALLTKSNSESLNPNQRSLNRRWKNGKKSFQSVLSVGNKQKINKISVCSVYSVRDKSYIELTLKQRSAPSPPEYPATTNYQKKADTQQMRVC